MVSYDVLYEVSYRGSYGEVNKVVGQKMGCEMISHCLGGILLSNKNAGNTLISRKQKRRSSK